MGLKINPYKIYVAIYCLCFFRCFDASDFCFLNGHDARFEVVGLCLGFESGNFPVSVGVSASLAVETSAIGDDEIFVLLNATEHVLNGGIGEGEMNEENLESLAIISIGFFDFVDPMNDFSVLECLFKGAHDKFRSAGLVGVTNANGNVGRHDERFDSSLMIECLLK